MYVWVLSSFLPQPENILIRSVGDSEVGVSVCEWLCVSTCSPCYRLVQGALRFAPNDNHSMVKDKQWMEAFMKTSPQACLRTAEAYNSIFNVCSHDFDHVSIFKELCRHVRNKHNRSLLFLSVTGLQMGSLGSRFQSSSPAPEEAAEGTSPSRKHGCECKKRKRNAQCDCESEQEEEDALLDTPRRYVFKYL